MIPSSSAPVPESLMIPDVPAIYANARAVYMMDQDGTLETLSHKEFKGRQRHRAYLLCHAPYTARRIDIAHVAAFDILELYAFVHPARFAVPTPVGVAASLGLSKAQSPEDYPYLILESARALLSDLRQDRWKGRADPLKIAGVMGQNGKGWIWTPFVFSALGARYNPEDTIISKADLNVWKNLPEWSESAPPPPASHHPVSAEETRERLQRALGIDAETRKAQADYASSVATMFTPPPATMHEDQMRANAVLIEAGTGVGKTLGYLSPASVWAQKNQGSVWISTFTKNLQRQITQELDRLYPDPDMKDSKVAVRKGRENYLCLLNLEDFSAGAGLAKNPRRAIAAGLMARWAAATRDGDLSGGDFPGWLTGLLSQPYSIGLADRRGECIYSACDHYHRCFVERSVRKARHAELVVANHALVMIQTADSSRESDLPRHYIFDEGHHLFDAADSAYAGHLSALETYDLRRWIRGNEGSGKSRARGLKRRTEGLAAGNPDIETHLQDVLEKARCLCSEGWVGRFKDNAPRGECESFLLAVYGQVYARADGRDMPYSLETPTRPIDEKVVTHGKEFLSSLRALLASMNALSHGLGKKLHEQADILEGDDRKRLDSIINALRLKTNMVEGWCAMLQTLIDNGQTPDKFVDWMEIERIEGRAYDVGVYRHWIDPMEPFAVSMKPHAHGITITSATLKDATEDDEQNWKVARDITGLSHLPSFLHQEQFQSPFDYPACTRVFVINDIRKDDMTQVATAYQTLFSAAGGGALGLFTAISRLRAVHEKIAAPLEENGLHLYAQHVDAIDNGTLVDIFRDDVNACLLGTDAVRDGVDVPGESLRLIVFDRVPWPRPTILHKARRDAFGKKQYDERIARLKLKQAFGRLIRRHGDHGVFVMLDSMLPSRLHGAFPPGVEIVKCPLSEAAREIREFLQKDEGAINA